MSQTEKQPKKRKGGGAINPPLDTAFYLRRNDALIRRAAIRHILQGRIHVDGIKSTDQLRDILAASYGISVTKDTVNMDLRKMRAVKVVDEELPSVKWWVIPAYHPQVEDLRNQMDPELIEAEVGLRLDAHVISIVPLHNMVHVLCEPRSGYLVAYWVSWLNWSGIVRVQEGMDSFTIFCVNDHTAVETARRLLGDPNIPFPEEGA